MVDRYDEALQALRQAPAPDRWNEIAARATGPGADAGASSRTTTAPDGRGPRPRWPLLLAAAACAAVVTGTVVLLTIDDGPEVTTDVPAPTTAPTTDAPTTTSTTATPTTTTTAAETPRPQLSDLGDYPVSACRGLVLSSSTPPPALSGTQQAPAPSDPRVPDAVQADLVGVFPGDTATRAILVLANWPALDEPGSAGAVAEGPFPGTRSWVAPYGDGWLAEIPVPLAPGTTCPATLVGTGINEADFRQFLAGLALEG